MNKNKIIVRIIAIILVAITVLGLIIPAVSASEIDEPVVDTSIVENDQSEVADDMSGLPMGFMYVDGPSGLELVKNEENPYAAVVLNGIPDGFDVPVVTIFIGNLETNKVVPIELHNMYGYVSNLELEDGYYVIFDNNIAWADKNGSTFSLGGGERSYIYIGSNYDPNKFDFDFHHDMNQIMSLGLKGAVEGAQIVDYNSILQVDDEMLKLPQDSNPVIEPENPNIENDVVEDPTQPTEQIIEQPQEDDDDFSFFEWLWSVFKSAPLAFILLAVSGIWYFVLKKQKANKLAEQIERDMNDSKRIE